MESIRKELGLLENYIGNTEKLANSWLTSFEFSELIRKNRGFIEALSAPQTMDHLKSLLKPGSSTSLSNIVSLLNYMNFPFQNMNFSHLDLKHADLSNSQLQNSKLSNNNLSHCNFTNSNLRNTNLRNSNLINIDFTIETTLQNNSEIHCLAFSSQGDLIVASLANLKITVWTLRGRLLTTFTGHEDSIVSVLFSPDDTLVASASEDTTIKL